MPKVSVIIPTYNSAGYVTQAVESVLAQHYQDYELIVVDDGSTDDTRIALEPYQARLTYLYQENQERSAARNAGIRAASGEYLAFLDADDLWMAEKLGQQVELLDTYSAVALTYCQGIYIDAEGNPVNFHGKQINGDNETRITISHCYKDLFLGDIVYGGGSSALIRRSLLDEVGLFDETLSYPEDWDLWMRLSKKGFFAYLPKPLMYYRVYGWKRKLAFEAQARLVEQHLRVIEKASAAWEGDLDELVRLRAQGIANIHTRAALANYQLGQVSQGREQLEKAMMANPGLTERQSLINLVVDRAKLIETDTGSYLEARKFIHTVFDHLPEQAARLKRSCREALAWLYIGGAFEHYRSGDRSAARRLLVQAMIQMPASLWNRGVLSVALDAWLGKEFANNFRRLEGRIHHLNGHSADA